MMPECIPKPDRRTIPDRRASAPRPTAPTALQAPAAASEREARLSRTFDLAPVALTHVTPEGRFIELNQRAVDLFGYSREELLELTFADLTHPDDLTADLAGRARLLAGEIAQHRMEKRLLRKNGTVVWGVLTMSLVRTAAGAPDYLIAATEDITARKCAEEALAASERRLGYIMATVPGMLLQCVSRPDGSFTFPYVGAGARELLGIAPEDIQRDPALFFAAIHPEDRPSWEGAVARAATTGELWRWEGRVTRPTGEERWIQGTSRGERLSDGSVLWSALYVDVTERRQAVARLEESEAQLRQAQKMEAIGRLAGGIAHDFNNLLMAILASAELLLEETAGQPGREDAEIIRVAAERGAALTRQLLAFSRQQTVHPRHVDPNAVVEDAVRMLRRTIGGGITLALDLEPALGPVLADPGQLEQAVVNLVVNARDAMPQGGRLTLRSRDVVVDEADAREHPERRSGMYVAIAVEDTGVGIAPELQSRLFEPYFTTKSVGQGSGLGLATAYGFVEHWGGWIDVQSEAGKGTTFTIYLPQHAGAPQRGEARAPVRQPRRTETILVVDDEATVRHSLRRLLMRQGYTVLEAAHGAEALRVVEESASPIDLVLTDVVMPVMDGHGLIAALRRRPGAPRIVAMSGHDRAAALREEPLPADVHFLQKPVTSAELVRTVRHALDAGPGSPAEHRP